MRICHVISGLDVGGAEVALYNLVRKLNSTQFENSVISLTDNGPIGIKMDGLGVRVLALGARRGMADPRLVVKLAADLRREKPDIIHCWMYHANLVGAVAAKFARNVPVVWGVRHGDPRVSGKRMTQLVAKVCASLSGWLPASIVFNSREAQKVHREIGYTADNTSVIPNGIDVTRFVPSTSAALELRRELGLEAKTFLIGLAARWHPVKDHETFVEAARLFSDRRSDTHFVLCGDNIGWPNTQLARLVDAKGMRSRMHLLGLRDDLPRVLAGLDLATTSSVQESFPNVVGEAMATGVPCVVTDVGDCALIVGDTGRVVPTRNAPALASAWLDLIAAPPSVRQELGRRARARITGLFDLDRAVVQYERLYLDLGGSRD